MAVIVRRQETSVWVGRPLVFPGWVNDAQIPRSHAAGLVNGHLGANAILGLVQRHLALALRPTGQAHVNLVVERHFLGLEAGPVQVRRQGTGDPHLLRRPGRSRKILEIDSIIQPLARLHIALRRRIAKSQRTRHLVRIPRLRHRRTAITAARGRGRIAVLHRVTPGQKHHLHDYCDPCP
ncbi:MAG: hypothetical protein BWX73_02465 [Lentisphaerae bacterium ADurb.Bin082]|nr:MAG: hypothetical protein BWX73_02465 [Lentisphaerae bacterium ADurb.Bin082]